MRRAQTARKPAATRAPPLLLSSLPGVLRATPSGSPSCTRTCGTHAGAAPALFFTIASLSLSSLAGARHLLLRALSALPAEFADQGATSGAVGGQRLPRRRSTLKWENPVCAASPPAPHKQTDRENHRHALTPPLSTAATGPQWRRGEVPHGATDRQTRTRRCGGRSLQTHSVPGDPHDLSGPRGPRPCPIAKAAHSGNPRIPPRIAPEAPAGATRRHRPPGTGSGPGHPSATRRGSPAETGSGPCPARPREEDPGRESGRSLLLRMPGSGSAACPACWAEIPRYSRPGGSAGCRRRLGECRSRPDSRRGSRRCPGVRRSSLPRTAAARPRLVARSEHSGARSWAAAAAAAAAVEAAPSLPAVAGSAWCSASRSE